MRFVAVCVASLLFMQLPAAASIISPAQRTASTTPWTATYGYLAWDATHGMLRLSGGDGIELEPASLVLTSNVAYSSAVAHTPLACDLALFASYRPAMELQLANLACATQESDERYVDDIRIAATSVCPEPATLTIWGISALALAAATYRRQKRGGKSSQHVQAAVQEYLAECDTPSQHFRLLSSYLTRLADDPNWSKQDVEAFYDEVVVALHRRREHAEVA